eukprot:maker-scaffold792_size96572-snap-gene-0.17 protein:Tk05402 transcript:maker-scaffold792_size96572-snap-gene-0.17-mRNA-1 annotation:"PREDICTED: uncharacterized protein LOC101256404"
MISLSKSNHVGGFLRRVDGALLGAGGFLGGAFRPRRPPRSSFGLAQRWAPRGAPDQMDSLVQRCHDLEVRIKRTEEERDVVIMENEDLFSHISSLASRIEYQEGRINPFENEIGLISEEISRLDLSFKSIHGALGNMSEKLKEINNIRESVQN